MTPKSLLFMAISTGLPARTYSKVSYIDALKCNKSKKLEWNKTNYYQPSPNIRYWGKAN